MEKVYSRRMDNNARLVDLSTGRILYSEKRNRNQKKCNSWP